jgi:very-short-patch-repair endonuclease
MEFARRERATANEFASRVWQMVRGRGCRGQKFRREHVVGPYTLDFCCVALKLDGADHFTAEGREHDERRDRYPRDLGYELLRIPGYDVLRDPRQVLQRIEQAIDARRAGA